MFARPVIHFAASVLFLIAGIASVFLINDTQDHTRIARQIEARVHSQIAIAKEQLAILQKNPAVDFSKLKGDFFLLTDGRIAAWSTNSFSPELSWFTNDSQPRFVKNLRGDFLTVSLPLDSQEVLMAIIPLKERYRITNRYLTTEWNPQIADERSNLVFDPYPGNGAAVIYNQQPLFYVTHQTESRHYGLLSMWLILTGILFWISGTVLWSRQLMDNRRPGWSLAVLAVSLGILRIAMITAAFPSEWLSSSTFDPSSFASSSFNPSIGDLLLNSLYILALCWWLFYRYRGMRLFKRVLTLKGPVRSAAAVVFMFVAFLGFLFPFLYYETVFHNSSITLDWTQSLAFEGPRIFAFISVLIGTVSSFLFCHVFVASSIKLSKTSVLFIGTTFIAGLFFAGYYWFAGRDYLITLCVGALYFTGLFATRWHRGARQISHRTFLYFTFGILCFSLQASLSVRKFTEERSSGIQYRFGQNFLVERDVLGEYLLNEAASRISSDPFIQSGISTPIISKGSVRQKVKQVYLSSYFNRYDVQIHLYSASGEPLDNLSRADLSSFVNQYKEDVGQTNYRGIYFVNRLDVSSAKRYVAVVQVTKLDRIVGYVALELSLKKIVPESVYPELLVDNRFAENFRSDAYSYAVYQDNSIVSSFGFFDYNNHFNELFDTGETEGVTMGGYHHVVVSGEGGRKAIVTTPAYPLLYLASNFALWMFLGVGVIAVGLVISLLLNVRHVKSLNFATRIQLYVFVTFFIPLTAVSITTLYWTSQSAEDRLNEEYRDRTRKLAEQVGPVLERWVQDEDITSLQEFLIESTGLAGVDASVYTNDGLLIATSQAQIFDNLILSNFLEPRARSMVQGGATSFVQEERIGRLSFNNSYRVLKAEASGESVGVLSIPFFDSGQSLDKNRVTILSNVLIVFIIIFILFTTISIVVTRWFTSPLRMITRSLSRTTLRGNNEQLNWQSNDEIGWMVKEYNRMVSNLEKSKVELARSQKESAWREMAQQVAHEIKNPLTPMKLTLQQMEMQVRQSELPREKTESAVKNLLVQLEILNEIATSFSSFAKMPAPILERVNLGSLVEKTVGLYGSNAQGVVTLDSNITSAFVMADDQLLSRIFSNLILNGLQAGTDDSTPTVIVKVQLVGQEYVVSFADDGKGIDPSMRDKVFLPHFTTKKSGSGLGLAIARQGVEQSGGRIWFETSSRGTVFYVALPAISI